MVLSQSSFSQHMSSLFIPMSKSETQERNWASSHLSHFFPSVPSACFPNRSQILALCLFSGLKLHHISPVLSQATSEIFFFLPLWSPLELILCRAPKILLFTKICAREKFETRQGIPFKKDTCLFLSYYAHKILLYLLFLSELLYLPSKLQTETSILENFSFVSSSLLQLSLPPFCFFTIIIYRPLTFHFVISSSLSTFVMIFSGLC